MWFGSSFRLVILLLDKGCPWRSASCSLTVIRHTHSLGQGVSWVWLPHGPDFLSRLWFQISYPLWNSVFWSHQLLISEGRNFIQQSPLPSPPGHCAQNSLLHPEFPRMIVKQDQSGPSWLSDQLRKVLFICVSFLFLFPSDLCQKPKDGIAQIIPGLHEPQKFYASPIL